MIQYVKSQAIFPYMTGMPRDVMTNTMHWSWDDTLGSRDAIADEIAVSLTTFYTSIYVVYGALYVKWSLATAEIFFMGDPPARIPEVRPLSIPVSSNDSNIPTEVSVVMTYNAATESGTDRRRLHNRIYLGGLANAAFSLGSLTTFPTVSSSFRTAICNAAAAMKAENGGALNWVQHSDASGLIAMRPIVGGWVDNSPDTQRRRSVDATGRTTWS